MRSAHVSQTIPTEPWEDILHVVHHITCLYLWDPYEILAQHNLFPINKVTLYQANQSFVNIYKKLKVILTICWRRKCSWTIPLSKHAGNVLGRFHYQSMLVFQKSITMTNQIITQENANVIPIA